MCCKPNQENCFESKAKDDVFHMSRQYYIKTKSSLSATKRYYSIEQLYQAFKGRMQDELPKSNTDRGIRHDHWYEDITDRLQVPLTRTQAHQIYNIIRGDRDEV